MKLKKIWLLMAAIMGLSVLGGCGSCSDGENDMSENNGGQHTLWSTWSTKKVVQNANYNSVYDRLPAEIDISLMQNETEGAQIIITAGSDIQSFSLEKTDLSDGNGNTIPADDIEVFQQKYLEIVRKFSPNGEFPAGSMVPDMLLPMDKAEEYGENIVASGKNQGITVEITTKSDTPAGIYTGTFVLDIDGVKTNIPVKCTVWDFGYDGRSGLQTSFLLYRNEVLAGEYDDSDEIMQSYVDFLLKYKVNTYIIKDSYPVDEWITEVKRLFENENCNSIIIPYNFALDYTADSSGADTVINFIRELVKITTEEKNYIDYAYFYPSNIDEADMNTGAAGGTTAKMAAAYRLLSDGGEIDKTLEKAVSQFESENLFDGMTDEFAEHVKQSILNIPSIFTNVNFVQSAVDDLGAAFCPYLSQYNDAIQAAKYAEQSNDHGKGLWTYTCSGPLYPYPSFHTDDYALGIRVTGWMEKKYNINGFLYWSVARYKDGNSYVDPYATAARLSGTANGDGYLLYPGRKYGSDEPFASIRLVEQRNSAEDYNMLSVYEQLIDEYAEHYGVADEIVFEDYVNDLYDGLFNGSVYNTDDALIFAAREELAKRILALKNEDKLLVNTECDGQNVNFTVFTEAENLSVNGEKMSGVRVKNGYRYTVTLSADSAQEIKIVTDNGEYSYTAPAAAKVTDFALNGANGVICSGREGDESTMSFVSAEGENLNVVIRSYYANGSGYGAEIGAQGIDGATQRLMPSVTFPAENMSGANNVYFSVKNTGNTDLEMYVQLVMDNGLTEEIGSGYCAAGKSADIRVHIDPDYGIDTSKATGVRIAFRNVRSDANGNLSLWADREFTLSDIWFDKK